MSKFYTDVHTKKAGEQYQIGSFKVIRAGLNHYFKQEKGIDVVNNPAFMKANMIFESVQVKAKKSGKEATTPTPHISDTDLIKVGKFFNVDHVVEPNPRILRHTVQFFIIYFFCHRGQENLYEMTKDHFELCVQPHGTEYVIQKLDEKDENHGIRDTEMGNQTKMYSAPGMIN